MTPISLVEFFSVGALKHKCSYARSISDLYWVYKFSIEPNRKRSVPFYVRKYFNESNEL